MVHNPTSNPHVQQPTDSGSDRVESSRNLAMLSSSSWKTRTNIPSLICAFLASVSTGGTTYAFGLYGAALKDSLDLSQSELDTISSANFCAGLLSWIPGLIVDRFGSRNSMAGGGILGAISLVLYWAVAKSVLPLHRENIVPTLCLVGVIIFLSNSTVIGSIFKILMRRCTPGDRGTAVGIAKGYVGLGAGAYATLFMQIRTMSESDLDFLLMAAVCNLTAATIPALLLLPSKRFFEDLHTLHSAMPDALTPVHFWLLYASLTAMATLIVGRSLLTLYQDSESVQFAEGANTRNYGLASLIVAVWFLPILCLMFVPLDSSSNRQKAGDNPRFAADKSEATNLISEPCSDDPQNGSKSGYGGLQKTTEEENKAIQLKTVENGASSWPSEEQDLETEEKTLPEMLATMSAWLFLWTATILVGCGIVITNNMGQMVQALDFPDVIAPSALAVFSVAQALTRVATGTFSDAAMTWKEVRSPCCGGSMGDGVPRTAFLIVASFAGFISHFILACSRRLIPFIFGIALSGAAFGMIWPLMVLIVGEVFGSANVGANYMFFDGFSCAAGTLLLSKFVAQEVYESHIPEGGDGVTCYGVGCYQMSHFIEAGLCLTCVATSFGVLLMTRKTYMKNVAFP